MPVYNMVLNVIVPMSSTQLHLIGEHPRLNVLPNVEEMPIKNVVGVGE